jgi:hypothetical protein
MQGIPRLHEYLGSTVGTTVPGRPTSSSGHVTAECTVNRWLPGTGRLLSNLKEVSLT